MANWSEKGHEEGPGETTALSSKVLVAQRGMEPPSDAH